MTKPVFFLLLAVFLSSFVLPAAVQPPAIPDPFEDFFARAKKMGDTPEGKAYEEKIGDTLGPALQASLKERTKDTQPPYKIRLVLIIATDGSFTAGYPMNDDLSKAVAKDLNGLRLAPPPKDQWLVAVQIEVKE
jgi:hypothetical protein